MTRLLYTVVLLVHLAPGRSHSSDAVKEVSLNDFNVMIHKEKMLTIFMHEDNCTTGPKCDIHNFTLVAEKFKDKLTFGRMDVTMGRGYLEEYTSTFPSIFFMKSKIPFIYNGSFSLENLTKYYEQVSDPNWKFPPFLFTVVDDSSLMREASNVPISLLALIRYTDTDDEYNAEIGKMKLVAEELKPHNIPVFVLNLTANPKVSDQVEGLDTRDKIVMLRYGKSYPFNPDADRNAKTIARFVLESARPGSVQVNSPNEALFKIHQEGNVYPVSFLGYFESDQSPLFEVFREVVNRERTLYRFFHTFDRATAGRFGCSKSSCILPIYKKELASPYDQDWIKKNELEIANMDDVNRVRAYIKKVSYPLVGQLNGYRHVTAMYGGKSPRLIMYGDITLVGQEYKEFRYYLKMLWNVANEFREHVTFVFANRTDHQYMLGERGLRDSDNDYDVIIEHTDSYVYFMKTPFGEKNLRSFVRQYVAGELRPVLKSDDLPSNDYDENGIRVVVGQNFEKVVFDDSRDVVVLLYVDWCKHCKKMQLVFGELPRRYSGHKKLEFVKMVGSLNTPPPEYILKEYPTVYFGKAGDKLNPIKFQQTADDQLDKALAGFVESHWTVGRVRDTTSDL